MLIKAFWLTKRIFVYRGRPKIQQLLKEHLERAKRLSESLAFYTVKELCKTFGTLINNGSLVITSSGTLKHHLELNIRFSCFASASNTGLRRDQQKKCLVYILLGADYLISIDLFTILIYYIQHSVAISKMWMILQTKEKAKLQLVALAHFRVSKN
ncbi:hypothetical protein BD560DRAFT_491162 [Blakeslea trispora]|nr:hypothetical protein BD560DRAFT_491162 [Blakeslea trispora]